MTPINYYIPPSNIAVVDANGYVSRSWYTFFSTILQNLGGPAVSPGINTVISSPSGINSILYVNGSIGRAALVADYPTLNQNTTGNAATTTFALNANNATNAVNATNAINATTAVTATTANALNTANNYTVANITPKHVIGGSVAPGIAANAGSGTSPTISIVGTDLGFKVTLTTGTTPSVSSPIFTVTFANSYSSVPYAVFSSVNAASASIIASAQLYCTTTATTFVLNCGTVALAAGTLYIWNVILVQ